MYLRATHYVPAARSNLKVYLASYVPSTSLWLGSLAFPAPTRYWLCRLAMTIELLIPILGSRTLAKTPAHPSHLQERFGLFTLIVLGESIVSVATTANGSWALSPIVVAVGGFGIAACLWWLYFSFLKTAVVIRGMGSVNAFNYGHLPIVMGRSLVAVGTEHTIVETATQSVLSAGARWALLGGVALCMVAISFIAVSAYRRDFCGKQ
ncbi:MAG: low temperature requirement protein A [Phormidesmis sp. CAN_BIN44]|nr:low temperature requirement protein A [Phormidesmis sp. CAN_BIN44]